MEAKVVSRSLQIDIKQISKPGNTMGVTNNTLHWIYAGRKVTVFIFPGVDNSFMVSEEYIVLYSLGQGSYE